MSEPLQHADFEPHVGKLFRFPATTIGPTTSEPTTFELRLVAIERGTPHPAIPRTPFSLTFQGPPGAVLPEGQYAAEIEGGTVLDFYIMPIHTPARDRQDYQAVFG